MPQSAITHDGDRPAIRLQSAEVKLCFDSDEVQLHLAQYMGAMIEEAYKKIEGRVPEDGGWFENFSACNLDTGELTEMRMDYSLFVERDETIEGNIILGLSVVTEENPYVDSSIFLTCGKRKQVLGYLQTERAQEDILKGMKRLSIKK